MPPCGGHLQPGNPQATLLGFKSCPRVGGILGMPLAYALMRVSSRAPVWGASVSRPGACSLLPGFKSCPRVGGIAGLQAPQPVGIGFKSCPRVGGIKHPRPGPFGICGFKSCPRVGGILVPDGRIKVEALFQVVPPCGGHLRDWERIDPLVPVSSRAPVWGASLRRWDLRAHRSCFKSCPRVGGIPSRSRCRRT